MVISHTDKVRDLAYHRDMLATGVNVEYDQVLRQTEDTWTLDLIETMAAEGRLSQIMAGTDGARRTLWTELGGGPGLAYLIEALQSRLAGCAGRCWSTTRPALALAQAVTTRSTNCRTVLEDQLATAVGQHFRLDDGVTLEVSG